MTAKKSLTAMAVVCLLVLFVYGFFLVGNPVLIARSDPSMTLKLDGRTIRDSETLYPVKPVYRVSVTNREGTKEYDIYPWQSEDSSSVIATRGEVRLNVRHKRVN